jgi:predicted PurR-regulated permease PerM
MMNRIKANQAILLVFVLFVSALFFAMIQYFLMAIFMAAIFSALAMPVFNRFEVWSRGRKSLSAALTMSFLLLIVFLPLAGLSGIIGKQAIRLSRIAVPWILQFREPSIISQHLRTLPYYADLGLYREVILQKAGELAGKIGPMLFNAISSLSYSTINNLFLLFVFLYTMFFFLKDGKQLLEKVLSYLPLTIIDQKRLLDKFLSVTRATIKGCMVLGILQGSLAGIAMYVAGIESAIFLGSIMAVILAFPVLGPPLVWILIWIPAIVYLAAAGQYFQALGLLLFLSIVVHPIDNILRPILVGRDTQMPELLIFLGTLGGLRLFGVFGIIIGPIIAALFMTIWDMYGETFSEYLKELKVSPQETDHRTR